ncbi:MAG TPA: amidohydrolase family protein [Verrucomicrobiae bacterium]|nr:amidohydrolase family protein [Verrucomicrobiae bacterium]
MKLPAIVDSHVHLWNPSQIRYPWLKDVPALDRAFLPADFSAAASMSGVGKMIFVESGCDPVQSLAEAKWVSILAEQEPRLKGIIVHAPLEKGLGVREELEVLAAMPLVKGIRRLLQGETDAGFCLRPKFVAGVKSLEKFNFTFDLCIRPEQLPSVTELVRQIPQVTFILDHMGKPNIRSVQTEPWSKNLEALAALPNVVCKISGLTTEADHAHWQPGDLKFYLDRALELFGIDRVIFGGDWPVATLATGYGRWIETVQNAFSPVGEAGLVKLFKTNAERIYRV